MKERKQNDTKWKVIATASLTGTIILGALYFKQSKEINKADDTIELVKEVVGGPLIDRLIKNEELKLSRTDNKINNILNNNMTKAAEKVLEEHKQKREIILETISDFIKVREALKREEQSLFFFARKTHVLL